MQMPIRGVLFVFEFLYVATLAFGGASSTAVAALECILANHLYALIFLLRGTVYHVVFNELGPYPVG